MAGRPHSVYLTDEEAKWADNHPKHDSKSGAIRAAIREAMNDTQESQKDTHERRI